MTQMKLAIIGAGPSAFYVASRLLSLLPHASLPALRIHMYDRLWAPHGLVRYGVAPDHPEVKNCTHKFDTAATDPRFRFFGNVNIGSTPISPIPHSVNLPLSSIFSNYSHLLFATGCTLPTLHPALPPSAHCVPALSLVHWYTQHPSRPPPPALDRITHVSLIGNGNVSLDIARMLLSSPSDLAKYDIPEHVLDVLSRSSVKHVSIIARRGPFEAAFTVKELRELMNLPEASMVPIDPSALIPSPDVKLTRQQTRALQLLRKGSDKSLGTTPKTWSLDFFRSPTGLAPPTSSSPLAQLSFAHTTLDPKTNRAVSTGETSVLPTSLVVTSLGFHSDPMMSFYDPGLGHLRTLSGRVISSSGTALRNVYASGWAATGAKGVLASTMMDAYAVADTIISDLLPKGEEANTTSVPPSPSPEPSLQTDNDILMNSDPRLDGVPPEIEVTLKGGLVTGYEDWKAVDIEEVRRGEATGKERERMGWEEARTFLAQSRTATS
ncbi:hypothetical protein PILCRDRAFT_823507 [Piloderma croceum F 1598]|uniref:NADPH:adrenodoxin oxidoreductase, mitochondrial n=1 Tax=Piloderma croceum (strain F 1598) TaxID=765440 RepID=A0A0C3BPN1_PILCF|nr:hypothetical protein PILCRDRAFT_823507 [Piloderma croceum F 1598]